MKIVKFIFSRGLPTTSNEDSKITIPAATKRLLHSADFYEMVRTRGKLLVLCSHLTVVDERTELLS